jgi:hypothetical protein
MPPDLTGFFRQFASQEAEIMNYTSYFANVENLSGL